ncbi:MAG TPA: 23S rRNA (uracil(1939)-C(5))-methyltransferase RlmD [Solirubrobacteraceae bacterium]|nr:23S rRNA (uracil(1939)-C(5))-methyltransferase RlmD [Solirubrobacteraceae bacterium]
MNVPGAEPAEPAETPAFVRPQRGDELELTIESLAFGGEGVARIGDGPIASVEDGPADVRSSGGGYVVFVAGAIPGDRVRALVHKRKRSYAHARTLEVLEPSPERVPPTAHHPGVPWQVLPYERQLEIKLGQVDEALRRIGRLEGFELEEIVPALEQWRYRNKLEYSFGGGPERDATPGGGAPHHGGQAGGELVCGFHGSAGANSVEPMQDCLLASELGNVAREAALEWCGGEGLSAWDRGWGRGDARAERTAPAADGRARLRNLVVREGRRTDRLQVRIVTTEGELEAGELAAALSARLGERLSGVLWTRTRSLAETTMGGETELVWGEAELPERLGELDLQISSGAFFQTNTEMAELLYGVAGEYAALEGWERVFDLYSGIGTIALTLAPRAGELWGIELIEQAVADAIAGARRNGITNARFFAGDTRLALPELVGRAGRPDVIVVDPPRAGLSKKVVHRIIDASPKRVVYVSCNPTTLAPNAAELVGAGWALRKVRPVDMFPQTHHIECVALFERDDGRRL